MMRSGAKQAILAAPKTSLRGVLLSVGLFARRKPRPVLHSALVNSGCIPPAPAPTDVADCRPRNAESVMDPGEGQLLSSAPEEDRRLFATGPAEFLPTDQWVTPAPEPRSWFAEARRVPDPAAPEPQAFFADLRRASGPLAPESTAIAGLAAPESMLAAIALPSVPHATLASDTAPAAGEEAASRQTIPDSFHSLIAPAAAMIHAAPSLTATTRAPSLLRTLPAPTPGSAPEPNLLPHIALARLDSPAPASLPVTGSFAVLVTSELSDIPPSAAIRLSPPSPSILLQLPAPRVTRSRGAEARWTLGAGRKTIRQTGERRAGHRTAIAAILLIGILTGTAGQLVNHPSHAALIQLAQNGGHSLRKGPGAPSGKQPRAPTASAEHLMGAPPPAGTPPADQVSVAVALGIAASELEKIRFALPAGETLAERYRRAEAALTDARSKTAAASNERDRLSAEESAVQQNLVTNATKLLQLEQAAAASSAALDRLNAQIASIRAGLARDRSGLAQALALLQRIHADQRDGALAGAADATRAMRATAQAGGALTALSRDATELTGQLKTLANLQNAAVEKHAETVRNQAALNDTRDDLDRLMAEKQAQQESLTAKTGELQKVMDDIGREAGSLKALMDRIAGLRSAPNEATPRIKAVGPGGSGTALARGGLRPPVAGKSTPGDPAGPGVTPGGTGPTGLWYQGPGRGEAVAPMDSEVVFAGPYQKLGDVLILELAGGYHLALAGLGRIDVRVGDLVLAGEPVGTLPEGKSAPLYMELRRNGKVVDLAPWVSADIGKAKGT